MKVIHKINMDLAKRGIIPRIDAVQDDKYSRVLEFSLYAEGLEWNPPVNAEIVVRYTRPDGKTGNYRALVTGDVAGTINGNKVSVTLAPNVLAVAGTAKVAVGLINDDVEITTFFAEINIQKNPGAAAASSPFGGATVSGKVEIDESCESFTINTGLSEVLCIVIARDSIPTESGTHAWLHSDIVDITNIVSVGTVTFNYGYRSARVSITSGVATVNQYNSNSPVTAGTYNWTAYGIQ